MHISRHVIVALAVVASAGCVTPAPETPATATAPGSGGTSPMFSPTPIPSDPVAASPSTPPSAAASPPSDAGNPTAGASGAPAPSAAPADAPSPSPSPTVLAQPRTGSVQDGVGDVAGEGAEDAPAWADLAGASIRVDVQQATIVLELAGEVPATTDDGEFVSIGTFHDITGDGYIDREVWAAGSVDGWGTSYWNNDEESVAFGAEDEVELELDGSQIRLTFPATHLDEARTGRWQVTLEWVRDTLLSERLAADDAPNHRNGATWGP